MTEPSHTLPPEEPPSDRPGLFGRARMIASGKAAPMVRWLGAGLAFMGLNTLLLYLMVGLGGMSVWLATLLSAEFGTILRFWVNEHWVFAHRNPTFRRLLQYHFANAGAFVVWWLVTNLLAKAGIHYLLAGIVAVGISTFVSMASNFLWIWRHKHIPHPR